ncbi:MAG TPA: hypothetical protein PKE16_08975 [Hyphomicrobium sp.]|nr:hypothetical protein [Hyphomicrobium sp.]
MVDRWKDRLGRVDRAVDRVMSEEIVITPMLPADYATPARDEARPIIKTIGLLHVDRGENDIGGNSRHVRNARVRLEITKSILPAGADIRENDLVDATDKGEHYKVDWIDRQHPGRLVLMLSSLE